MGGNKSFSWISLLYHKSIVFLGCHNGGGVMNDFVYPNLQYYSIFEINIPTEAKAHIIKHTVPERKVFQRVFDALKLPSVNLSNCPFVCYPGGFCTLRQCTIVRWLRGMPSFCFQTSGAQTWFNHDPCVTHHWSMHGSFIFFSYFNQFFKC